MDSTSFQWNLPDSVSQAEKRLLRQKKLTEYSGKHFSTLFEQDSGFDVELVGKKNCENLIGSVTVPVGMAGPTTLSGDVEGEVFFPLATTEGALVASVNRGCKALRQSNLVTVLVEKKGMSRAPVFECVSGMTARNFSNWLTSNFDQLKKITEATSHHLTLLSVTPWVRGRYVYARFVFDTQEAMGMNMVTIALAAWWEQIQPEHPTVKMISVSSNVCSDKKDSVLNRLLGRGYWVQAEIIIPLEVVRQVLKVEPAQLVQSHIQKNLVGSNLAGSFSQNMQVSNVIAALFLATGQDLGHVTESSQATLALEIVEEGLYAALTLPDLVVGTVGGGTWLPAQSEARQLMFPQQEITTVKLAGAIGVACLAGELSGLAALSTNTLASAHAQLGRLSRENQ